MVYVYLAEGFEETEMIAPLDIMRRAGLEVFTVSVTPEKQVMGSHGIKIEADMTVFEPQYSKESCELFVLPGGMPGTLGLENSSSVRDAVMYASENGKYIAAICAAPSVLGKLGVLSGKRAVCYPGFEQYLKGAVITENKTETDGNIITAVGMGAAVEFGLAITEALCGKETAEKIKNGIRA